MVACTLLATIAFSCKSDIEKVQELSDAQNVPSLRVENLNGRVTEMGDVKMRFITPRLLQYNFATEKHTDFPQGIELYRYKDSVTLESSLLADEAINYEAKSLWEVTGNVKLRNAKGELLETEKLFWDQKAKRIYTDAWVKITNKDAVINGEGLESDEAFDSYEVKRISNSVIYVEDKKDGQ
ncbi:MAG: LPS export ABC transporter periplasmic protein LptC [Prevotellaceae bacterium]|jgi:LPS export ABC transporter protein LptC|nr:LPS export ABC transporter periplasmic protein LptC [Prevotellaceae bacterium]